MIGWSVRKSTLAGHFLSGHFLSGHFLSGHFLSGQFLSGHFLSGHFLSGHFLSKLIPVSVAQTPRSGKYVTSLYNIHSLSQQTSNNNTQTYQVQRKLFS